MKFNFNKLFACLLVTGVITIFAACNKDVADPVPLVVPTPTGQSISELIAADTSMSILQAGITRASTHTTIPSLSTMLSDRTAKFTFFAPTNSALRAAFAFLGIPPSLGVNALRPGELDTLIRYHLVGGALTSAEIPSGFVPLTFPNSPLPINLPNLQLPSQFVLQAPGAIPSGLRMSVFPSKRGTNLWANNVPLIQTDIIAANGVIHKAPAVLLPPSQVLLQRINADPNLNYLEAAIQRADSGTAPATTLAALLQNPGANFTVFAPNDNAMQAFLVGSITQALIARGLPAATAQAAATALVATYGTTILTNPVSIPDAPLFPPGTGIGVALATALSPTTVKGLAIYHLFGTRAFSVNLPTTSTAGYQTLLNSPTAIPNHPGVTLAATFGATGVTAATIKGFMNTTASNLLINPTPGTGSSDQHYINGTLHIIDQVLRP